MKAEGIRPIMPAGSSLYAGKTEALKRQIEQMQKEVSQLEQKGELSREEEKKKRELEQKIAQLKQQMQRTKAGEERETREGRGIREKTVNGTALKEMEVKEPESRSSARWQKENGKGDVVDELI